MTDRVIVTVRFTEQGQTVFEDDLELSANVPMDELKEGILKALQKEKRDLFLNVQSIDIFRDETPDRIIGNDETLASAGIWDGSILILRRHR